MWLHIHALILVKLRRLQISGRVILSQHKNMYRTGRTWHCAHSLWKQGSVLHVVTLEVSWDLVEHFDESYISKLAFKVNGGIPGRMECRSNMSISANATVTWVVASRKIILVRWSVHVTIALITQQPASISTYAMDGQIMISPKMHCSIFGAEQLLCS